MSSELEPKLQLARQLGAKTALGAAMIFYVMHHETDSNTIFSDTDKSAGGSLNLTTDEKIWTKTLVSIICNRAAELNSKYPAFYRRKCHILTILRESDDWNLDNIAETAKKF